MSEEQIRQVWGPGSKRHVMAVGIRHDNVIEIEVENGDLARMPCLRDVVTPTSRTRSGSLRMMFQPDERVSGKIIRDGIEIASGLGSQSLYFAPDRDWAKRGREPWAVGLAPCPEEAVEFHQAAKPDPAPKPKRTAASSPSPSGPVCADDQILLDRYGLRVGSCLCRHHDDHRPSAHVFHGQDDGRLLAHCSACATTWTLAQFVGERGVNDGYTNQQISKQAYAVSMNAREVFLSRRLTNVTLDLSVRDPHYEQALALAALKDVSVNPEDMGDMYAEAMIGFVLTGSREAANVGKAVLALAKVRGWIENLPHWASTTSGKLARLRIVTIAKRNLGLLPNPPTTLPLVVRRRQEAEVEVGEVAWGEIWPPYEIEDRCTGPPGTKAEYYTWAYERVTAVA
jgi:hypothetical protein